jgi:hypothetical protein
MTTAFQGRIFEYDPRPHPSLLCPGTDLGKVLFLYRRDGDSLAPAVDVLLLHWLHFTGLSLGWSSVILTRLTANEVKILSKPLGPQAVEVACPAWLSHESVKHWRHIPCLVGIIVHAVVLAEDGVLELGFSGC